MKSFTLVLAVLLVALGLTHAVPKQKHYLSWTFEEVDSEEHGQFQGSRGTNCSCGTTNKAKRRIVGGQETQENEYPHMAGLGQNSGYGMSLFCGCTIISEHHALTAAHCTDDLPRGTRLSILVGAHSTLYSSKYTRTYDVDSHIEHEGYNPRTYANDIALLTVYNKISFNQAVGPACLPTRPMSQLLVGDYVKVTGWGDTSFRGTPSKSLLKVNLKVIPVDQCAPEYTWSSISVTRPTQICTYRPYKDACQGDSGGPVTWLDPETNRYTLVGVVSFGEGCATTSPGVNTDVSAFMPWIQSTMARTARTTASRKASTCVKV